MEVGFPISSPGDFESVQTIARHIKNSRVCALSRALEKDIFAAAEALKVADQFRIHTFRHFHHPRRKQAAQEL